MSLQTQFCEVHLGQYGVVQCWQLIFQQGHLEIASGDQALSLALYWKYGLLNFQKLLHLRITAKCAKATFSSGAEFC